MAIHKFTVNSTGTVFYYDNVYDGMLDKNRQPLSQPHNLPAAYIDFVHSRNADKNKVIAKSNQPVMIKVILGHRCNFSCGYCLDTETELLTMEGWKTWNQISIGDIAVGFDIKTGKYHYGKITDVIVKNYSGPMVHTKTKHLDFLATPEHRVVYKWKSSKEWMITSADKIKGHSYIPAGGAPSGAGIPHLSTDMCRILGWIITDGAVHHDMSAARKSLCLSQATNSVKCEQNIAHKMSMMLDQIDGVTKRVKPAYDTINDDGSITHRAESYWWYFKKDIAETILCWLGDDIHRIPRRLLTECSHEQLCALFEGLMEGDGTSEQGRWRKFYPGKHEGLADDFQELALRLGWRVTKKWEDSQRGQWHLYLSRRLAYQVKQQHITTIHYEGIVWDITVPEFGTFVARRNGKVFVTGNCMQDELSSKCDGDQRAKEKVKALTLKEKIETYLDLSHIERIELWGGEAFLYWHEVTALMQAFDREGLTWYIPTNGSLIDERHIEFFKTLKGTVCIGISHDGPAHTITRGPDFLEKSVEVIRALQAAHPKVQFSFNPVISNKNYDLFAINDFFKGYLRRHGLKNVPLMFEIIQVYNLDEVRGNSRSFALMGDDLERYKVILRDYLEAHHQQFKLLPREEVANGEFLITNLYELYGGASVFAKELTKQDVMHSGAKCQADQERQLSIDMDGNVRTCQNVGKEAVFGDIAEMDKVAVTNIDTNQGPHCGSCRVRFLCKSQCPIKQHPDVFDTNCKINKVHYSAIQDAALRILYGPVTYEGIEK